MDQKPPSRITAGLRIDAPGPFKAGGLKALPDSESRVRTIAPDSVDWNELRMGRRLQIAPFLEDLIRQGRARLVFNKDATSTCEEKAAAAGIPVESTVKAMYCKDMYTDERFVIAASGKGRISLIGILNDVHDYAQLQTCGAEELPSGMQFGTCSPFVSKEILDKLEMVAIEDPKTEIKRKGRTLGTLGELEGDFSIGGVDSISHHLSVRMNYADFAAALTAEYGDKARVISGIKR
jgi:prolyl-tRNA editing enzyme YbaK/EbsC (Cys-tRNA(Pro) deacylase)